MLQPIRNCHLSSHLLLNESHLSELGYDTALDRFDDGKGAWIKFSKISVNCGVASDV
jgi:hypothetical protein